MFILFDYCFGCRYDNLVSFPDSGYHELDVRIFSDFLNAFPDYFRIADQVLCHECVVSGWIGRFLPAGLECGLLQDGDTDDHADHSEGISYGTCDCHIVRTINVIGMQLKESLLGGSQHRSVGDSP